MFSLHRRPGVTGGAPMDRRILLGGLCAVALAAAVGFGVARLTAPAPADAHAEESAHGDGHDEDEGLVPLSAAEAERLGVTVTTVSRGGGGELILPGRVALVPGAGAAVDAPLAGVVLSVHVGPGDPVRAGAVLATVRSPDGAASRADVDAAQATLDVAQAAERRDRTLFEQGWIARSRLDVTEAEARRAEAALRAARARVTAFGAPGPDGRVAIRAPIAGVVTSVSVTPGQVLHEEDQEVAAISDARRVELAFDAPPHAADSLGVGDVISASTPGGEPIAAVVTAVAPANAAGVVVIRARADGVLPAVGTVISARLASGGGDTPTVPLDAVQTLDGTPSVFVLDDEGFRAAPVVTGAVSAGRIEILSGLDGNERIAGRNAFLLKAELGRGDVEHAH